MTVNETIERVKALWSAGDVRPYSDAERAEIETLYTAVLGRQIRTCNCREKWRDAVVEMYSQLKKHRKMHTKSQYILKAGVVIQPDGTSGVYSNANLTDEIAAEFLKKRPNARGLFERIPETTSGDGKAPKSSKNGQSVDVSNVAVRAALADALKSGRTRKDIRKEFSGKEIDGVKLTGEIISAYFKAIDAETAGNADADKSDK